MAPVGARRSSRARSVGGRSRRLEEGYYFTADNPPLAADRYEQWKAWTEEHQLEWDGVGLDVEPGARIHLQIMDNPWGLVPLLLPRLLDHRQAGRSRAAYSALVGRIREDGWTATVAVLITQRSQV